MGRSGAGTGAASRDGTGLPRPPEPFERVYSAPDPPAAARRFRLLALSAVVVVLGAATGGGALLLRSKDGTSASPPRTAVPSESAPAPSESAPATESAAPSPAGAAPIAALPEPCGMVTAETVRRTIPDARQEERANSTLTTCTYSSSGSAFRWLRVETYLYAPANTATPVEDARRFYDAQWRQAHDAPLVRTVTLEPQPGLGDQAYRWFTNEKGQPTVVGQVTARTRNVVITVSYSERGEGTGRERECLAAATSVAREVLTSLQF
ncbi:hypothetical protein [Actinomadura algeriensis]|uniref:DUF3558 domain-containing protein n=1 Tax=Actinomadura algeriensis TaxID=1679523 RepID=A0ABR9JLK8_9ACTN|nr:hypothetical protein [Actinomadura algeriensis]MBE1531000.1 hypothetical protein [Actinomadura algeriensis]